MNVNDTKLILKRADIDLALYDLIKNYVNGKRVVLSQEERFRHVSIDYCINNLKNGYPFMIFSDYGIAHKNRIIGEGQIVLKYKDVLNGIPEWVKENPSKKLFNYDGGPLHICLGTEVTIDTNYAHEDIHFKSDGCALSPQDMLYLLNFDKYYDDSKPCSISITLRGEMQRNNHSFKGQYELILYREKEEGFIGLHSGDDFQMLVYLDKYRLERFCEIFLSPYYKDKSLQCKPTLFM